ncbi:cytochrome b [Agitococcus lubricus]|uniref:[NiFe]-hydrogenase II apoprotein large subunit n=1 Tax=Agitococcus lubricus TaxID=1077255 RepID=A0A2T5J0I0_9GAMM|nr:cytochrome b [Agitococcus lubricus]PTQ89853.1 [NiFe]-hydrogenase II apoprotein large subunit [Agitococcus lubricus]
MSIQNTHDTWGQLAKLFHWLSVVMLLAVWGMVAWHEASPKDSEAYIQSIMLHKALGVSLGTLMLARLTWRLINVTPRPLAAPAWQQMVASYVHGGLYLALLAMPVTGMVMSQLAGKPISLFGFFELPQWLTVNKELAGDIKELHEDVFWPLLVLLTMAHIGAAIYHQKIVKDGLIQRML